MTGQLPEAVPTPKETSGGSAETEVSEVAVNPASFYPACGDHRDTGRVAPERGPQQFR